MQFPQLIYSPNHHETGFSIDFQEKMFIKIALKPKMELPIALTSNES